jgi:hypothetical protein
MASTIIVILLALGVGGSGLDIAVDHIELTPRSAPDIVGLDLADEMAAFGLARAADARVQGGQPDEVGSTEAVDGLTQATEALTQAIDNAPEQAEPGLQRALDAVTNGPANGTAAPATGGAPAQVTAPPVTAPPVTAPPVTTPPVDTPPSAPPVDTPAGPPNEVPGGRP